MNITLSNNLILPKYLMLVKKKGSNDLLCVGWVGQTQHHFFGGVFHKAKYEIRWRKNASEQPNAPQFSKCLDWSGWRAMRFAVASKTTKLTLFVKCIVDSVLVLPPTKKS